MKKVIYILLLSLVAVSCKVTRQFQDAAAELFRGEVVAKVGNHKLYRSQLQSYIPAGVSPEDSASLARQWINAWAEDLLLLDMAEEQLSGKDKDVSKELEEYRRTLLKYRYEQLYINQRLDTLITDEEVEQYGSLRRSSCTGPSPAHTYTASSGRRGRFPSGPAGRRFRGSS